MAFCDDRKFLLSHIRHSFITCDDTGMCEVVMLNETMPTHLPGEPDVELLDCECAAEHIWSDLAITPLFSFSLISFLLATFADSPRCGIALRAIGDIPVVRYNVWYGVNWSSSSAIEHGAEARETEEGAQKSSQIKNSYLEEQRELTRVDRYRRFAKCSIILVW